VFVSGIPESIGWPELKDHFKKIGVVAYASVSEDENGRSKGVGIVQFETGDAADEAIRSMRDLPLRGSTLFVRKDIQVGLRPQLIVLMQPKLISDLTVATLPPSESEGPGEARRGRSGAQGRPPSLVEAHGDTGGGCEGPLFQARSVADGGQSSTISALGS
jgi:RNA recognition motif-containing protein